MKVFDLENRLIEFAAEVIQVAENLPNTVAGNHLSYQLIKSGTSPALNYGEAQGAESRRDFVHKMKISLKELKETFNCLRIIKHKSWLSAERLEAVLDENNQLISIFVTSIKTATKNNQMNKGSTP